VTRPTSEEVQAWIKQAYREPENKGLIDAPRFTRWNMEVAFQAGYEAVRTQTAQEDVREEEPNVS
jgi:hypothetical protein